MNDRAIAKLSAPDWPEPLRALPTDRMRFFVLHYLQHRNGARAAKEAGYFANKEHATALDFAQTAYELLHRQDVIDATLAMTKLQLRSLAPAAIAALKEMVEAPGRDAARVRAVTTVLERTDAAVQKVEVNHPFDPIRVTLDEIVRLRSAGATREAIMLALGFQSDFEMTHYESLLAKEKPVIDADYEELPAPERDPDAELLGE